MEATMTPATGSARRWMRAAWILIPGVLFICLLAVGLLRKGSAPAPGDAAPAFEAEVLGGGSLSSDELRGRPVVLNFWASWCVPCKDEAPILRDEHARLGDRIAFVGVDIRDAKSDAEAFVDEYGIAYPSVRDESLEIYDDYGLTGQPETFFIDAKGVIVDHVPGPLTREALRQRLDVLVRRDG